VSEGCEDAAAAAVAALDSFLGGDNGVFDLFGQGRQRPGQHGSCDHQDSECGHQDQSIQNEGQVPQLTCAEARWVCTSDAECGKALEYYHLYCRAMFRY